MTIPNISMDAPVQYRIKVSGSIREEWFSFYDSMVLEVQDTGDLRPLTTLTGHVTDQAALISMLALLYDMQCPLLSVECLLDK
jgi:hypothetical protein